MIPDLASRLITLGFKPHMVDDPGDFVVADEQNGFGPKIVQWLSDEPQPSPQLLQDTTARIVPAAVTRAQALLAIDDAGLYDAVELAVNQHPVRAVKIWYANALQWERGNAYIQALAIELGISDEQVDNLFIAAGQK